NLTSPRRSEHPMASSNLDRDALAYHEGHRPGKIQVAATKPMVTQRDLSLAYSPGGATPPSNTTAARCAARSR
ncbi:MAG: hypothetical protein ACHP83_14865, partial [Burkholderiales bacterium]